MKTKITILIVLLFALAFSGLLLGIAKERQWHTCPEPEITYPTRPEMQMFLREHYEYKGDIDGRIFRLSNAAWLLYEQDLMNRQEAERYERLGGATINEKLWKE